MEQHFGISKLNEDMPLFIVKLVWFIKINPWRKYKNVITKQDGHIFHYTKRFCKTFSVSFKSIPKIDLQDLRKRKPESASKKIRAHANFRCCIRVCRSHGLALVHKLKTILPYKSKICTHPKLAHIGVGVKPAKENLTVDTKIST